MINKILTPRIVFPLAFALTLIIAGLACGAGASAPSASAPAEESIAAAPSATEPANAPAAPTQIAAPAAILEARRLTLEFPPKMRAGVEGDVVRLTLEVDRSGNITPTAQIEGHVIAGQVIEIPDLYQTHNVTAEARLDMAGLEVRPPGSILEPLEPGQSATFYWSIRPPQTGVYRGTVWLHLNFTDKSTGDARRIAVSAQIIEIEAVDFFGLSVNLARTSGVVGSVVGGLLGFPFLENIVNFLLRRKKK